MCQRLQAIYLRPEPASYKFLESVRSQFDGPDTRPEPLCAIPIIFDLLHSPLQDKQLEKVLCSFSSVFAPFPVCLNYPFRNWNNELKAVHFDIRSELLNMLNKELRHELRDFMVLERRDGVLRMTRLKNLPPRPFAPKVTITSKLFEDAADHLVRRLKEKYGDEPGSLDVQGLSIGSVRGRIGGYDATTVGSTDMPWRHFQFTGTK
jgi:hypothetical protein